MGVYIPAGSSRAVVRPVFGIYSVFCAANQPQQNDLPPGIRDLVRGGQRGAAEVVGGVGWLSQTRVSCSALPVFGGLSALGGLYFVFCRSLLCGFILWNCTKQKYFCFFAIVL